jgi:hypothetical protein
MRRFRSREEIEWWAKVDAQNCFRLWGFSDSDLQQCAVNMADRHVPVGQYSQADHDAYARVWYSVIRKRN